MRCRSIRSTSPAALAARGSTTERVSSRNRRLSPGPKRTMPMSSGEKTVVRRAWCRPSRRRTACRLTMVRDRPAPDSSASMVIERPSTTVWARRIDSVAPRLTIASLGDPRNDCREER